MSISKDSAYFLKKFKISKILFKESFLDSATYLVFILTKIKISFEHHLPFLITKTQCNKLIIEVKLNALYLKRNKNLK
jgi:hypothetical protein